MRRCVLLLAAALATAACEGDTTPDWQLAHDRIVAVRATPPRIPAGASAALDVLITTVAAGPSESVPAVVSVAPGTPSALAGAVAGTGVIAPGEAMLEAARVELGQPAGTPVALDVVLTVPVAGAPLVAVKTVWLGDAADNPTIAEVRIAGAPADSAATVPPGVIELAVDAEADDAIHWLTSIGDLDDAEDPVAHLEATEPGTGALVVVRRDVRGGVAWRLIALSVE